MDYDAIVNQSVILNGQTSSVTVPITIRADDATEGEEYFAVLVRSLDTSVHIDNPYTLIRIADNNSKN